MGMLKGIAMVDLLLLSEAQVRRIKPYLRCRMGGDVAKTAQVHPSYPWQSRRAKRGDHQKLPRQRILKSSPAWSAGSCGARHNSYQRTDSDP